MNEINYFSVTSSNFFFLKKYIYFVLLKYWQNLKTRNFKRTQDFVNFAYAHSIEKLRICVGMIKVHGIEYYKVNFGKNMIA